MMLDWTLGKTIPLMCIGTLAKEEANQGSRDRQIIRNTDAPEACEEPLPPLCVLCQRFRVERGDENCDAPYLAHQRHSTAQDGDVQFLRKRVDSVREEALH
jgi:hypothetical protein